MKKTDTMPCEVVRDLLPLYRKHQVGEETRQSIESHLLNCPECTQLLEKNREPEWMLPGETPYSRNSGAEVGSPSKRRVGLISIVGLILIFLACLIWFMPAPSDMKQMEQALVGVEELNYCTGAYESADGTTGSLSDETREQNIQDFNQKIAQYCSRLGRPYDAFRETHEDLINRVNLEIP